MKKLLKVAAAIALSVAFATALPKPAHAEDVAQPWGYDKCTVATIGTQNGAHGADAKFVVRNDKASVRFEVKGPEGCRKKLALKLYYTLNEGGLPRESQQLVKTVEEIHGVGKNHMSINLPEACYYQLDLVNLSDGNDKPGQSHDILGYLLGGKKSCIKETPQPTYQCDALSATQLSRTSYSFKATASGKNGAEIVSYSYDFGDGKTETVKNGKTSHIFDTVGSYRVRVTANVKVSGKTVQVSGPNCVTTVTVAPAPVYECTALASEALSLYNYKFTPRYVGNLTSIDYDFGDGTKLNTLKADAVTHQYAKAGDYTTTATLHFVDANGVALSDSKCAAQVSIDVCATNPSLPENSDQCVTPTTPTTPTTPVTPATTLVKTGTGSVAAIFAAVTIIGVIGHNLLSRRVKA